MLKKNIKELNIGVIGGSIAGCATALLLLKTGANVTILERSHNLLQGRGAGVMLPESLVQQYIELNLFDEDIPRLPVKNRVFKRKSKKDLHEEHLQIWQQTISTNVSSLNWGHVYRNLRKRIPEKAYFSGEEVISLEWVDSKYHVMTATGKHYQFDLIIAADGINSAIRKMLFSKQVAPNYAGYVAWRGITSLSSLQEHALFAEHDAVFYVFPKGHLLLYLIPDYQNPKHKLLNWVMYDAREKSGSTKLLIDKQGIQHAISIPPGRLNKDDHHYLQTLANAVLPETIAEIIRATEQPFLQAIFDFQLPVYQNHRIIFSGDAALVLRPHVASGVAKALTSAINISKLLEKIPLDNHLSILLSDWILMQAKLAATESETASRMGAWLVTGSPDWENMTPEEIDLSWNNLMAGKSWYMTNKQSAITSQEKTLQL